MQNSAVRLVPADSVAIVTRSGILERTVPISRVPFATTLNQDMKAVCTYGNITTRWVAWCLRSLEQVILKQCRKAGTTVASLSTSALMDLRVPVAPLAEQHRIVEALENHLSRLDAACSAIQSTVSRTKQLQRSITDAVLRGERVRTSLTEGTALDLISDAANCIPKIEQPWEIPGEWLWTTIGKIFDVHVGTTPSRKIPEYWNGPIPWVSSGEVNFNRISYTREHISESAVGNRTTRIHPPGTVMLAMIGEGKTRGQCAILDIEAAHNQNAASIRVSKTRILPEYVYITLRQRYQESRNDSSGGNQPALNKAKVQDIPIPIPPLSTQRDIVDLDENLSRLSEKCRAELDRTLTRSAHLRRSLLHRAFTGRLVPQDPADEPASVLLDRIRAERAAQAQGAHGGKAKRARRAAVPKQTTAGPAPAAKVNPIPTDAVQLEF